MDRCRCKTSSSTFSCAPPPATKADEVEREATRAPASRQAQRRMRQQAAPPLGEGLVVVNPEAAEARAEAGLPPSPDSPAVSLLGWVLGCAFVYAGLFGTGSALYGHWSLATAWGIVFVVSGVGLLRIVPRMWASPGT